MSDRLKPESVTGMAGIRIPVGTVHKLDHKNGRLDKLGAAAAEHLREADRCDAAASKAAAQAIDHRNALRQIVVEVHAELSGTHGAFTAWYKRHGLPKSTVFLYVQESKDPDARERTNETAKNANKKRREKSKTKNVLDQTEHLSRETDEDRWNRSASARMTQLLSMRGNWQKEFGGDWRTFIRTDQVRALLQKVKDELPELLEAMEVQSKQLHPLAAIFPMIHGQEYEAFKASISNHGILEPIVLYEGKILDGKIRYRACMELGIEPKFTTYTGESPVLHVWSLNAVRKHLTPSEVEQIQKQRKSMGG